MDRDNNDCTGTLRPFKDCEGCAGEMARWLRAGSAPEKDLSSIPSIHVAQLPKVKMSATGTLDTSGICGQWLSPA